LAKVVAEKRVNLMGRRLDGAGRFCSRRNFSRGGFTTTKIKLKVVATDLNQTLSCLKEPGAETITRLPDLLEPWEVISESGAIGQHIELIVVAKAARFGHTEQVRLNLLALIQARLAEAGITLAD
jgi:hypothetical protein